MIDWQRLILLLCLFISSSVSAQTYYFANTGNDTNDGLSPQTAWQTTSNLNTQAFSDGDTFLFKRGDVFRGSIKLLRSPTNLTFSTYGEGDRAVIAGSMAIQNWTPTTHPSLNAGFVYEANVAGLLPQDADGNIKPIQYLFVNGNLMTIARYPNVNSALDKNWLKVGSNAGKDYFTDPVLAAYGKPDNYWKGATLRIRNYSWTNTVREITGYSAAAGRLSVKDLGSQLPEWGYFIDDKLEELDFAGEWYYDADNQKVYLYPPAGVDPNQALIEGAVYETGLSINNHKDNALVENLLFRHFTTQGMHVNSSDNVTVRQCYFLHNLKGITTWNTADLSINNNEIHYQLHSSIGLQASVSQGFDVKGSVVENNTIMNTAMYRAYGVRYDGVYQGNAIDVYGKAYTVRGNYIENVAENGMYLKDGGHHVIENNVVKNALLILNDGGAISIGSDGNTIRGNFLSGTVGNIDESNGCGSTSKDPCTHHSAYGMGIGSDSGFENNVIENNVIFNNSDMGIRLNAFQNTTVRNNVVYNNDPQIVVQDKLGKSVNNTIENNIIISLHPDQLGLQLTNETHHGDMNNNYYCNPYSDLAIMRDGQRYSLPDWKQSFTRYDQSSVDCGLLLPTENVQGVGENLITNSTFDTDIKSWGPNSKPEKIFQDTTRLDNGSLKAVFDTSASSLSLVPNTLSLQKDQWYRLVFSVVAEDFGDIQLRLNQTKPKYVIYEERFFAMDTQRRDYQYIFKNQLTDDTMKFLFTTNKDDARTYWIDNVYLQAVNLQPTLPADKQIKLFTNPTYETKTVSLQGVNYVDLAGQTVSGQISLAPFTSAVLVRANNTITAPATLAAPTLSLKVKQNKVTLTWTAVMGAQGYSLYYTTYPNAQPQFEKADMQLNRQLELELPEGFELPIDGVGFYAVITAYDSAGTEGRFSNVEHFMLH
ncbi:right-handed parallel beta-helix repeat-containing protein [Candidatus Albibeggiatoa sp. nov. NOAA]|uniref:right-handed parallel beta-helix repeat-containing protein n=1 Tax=Candidatus Albibeggiatoa sp. nov. NOAA TaxID=3162724 RepID=UPI0032F191C6|nr:right-handed parallel beta-helix repeat-containing protein [Thiotrichaceae bacterium]